MKTKSPEHLFAYGTLCDPHVQLYVFGRNLPGQPDALHGYFLRERAVADRYPAIWEGGADSEVRGIRYTLTGADLIKADAYETRLYYRAELELASGTKAWVYLPSNPK